MVPRKGMLTPLPRRKSRSMKRIRRERKRVTRRRKER